MKRKALGVLLSIMMLGTCVFTGCGEGGSEAPASGSQAADTAESTETAAGTVQAGSEAALEYGGNDISEHKATGMYLIGGGSDTADAGEEGPNAKMGGRL